MNYKEYFYSLKPYILATIAVFVLGSVFGYFATQIVPDQADRVFEEFQNRLRPVFDLSPLGQFLFIAINNTISLILVLVLGITFGIYSLLAIFSNGSLLGIVGFFALQEVPFWVFLLAILPHGIIEIPVLLVAGAIGLKIGHLTINRVFKKQTGLKEEYFKALKFFGRVLLPLLILAAFIEIFVTGRIFGL